MKQGRIVHIIVPVLFLCIQCYSQQQDSSGVYRKIERFSSRNKYLYMLYESVFRPVDPNPVAVSPALTAQMKPGYYKKFEGKVIRFIDIRSFDPFGYDIHDTSVVPDNILQKGGNSLHIRSRPFRIRHLILFKKYDTFDSLRVRESERLIRSQAYVREVFVTPVLTAGDSVDVYIRVYDQWSIVIAGYGTTTTSAVMARDRNFLGMGHTFQNRFVQDFRNGKNTYESNYFVPTIYNSYVNATLHYRIDEDRNYNESCSLDRPFFSALTSWGGGLLFVQNVNRSILYNPDSSSFFQKFMYNAQDAWIGHSWQIHKGHTEDERTTNLTTSFRYLRVNYVDRPPASYDTEHLYANQDFFLTSVGVSRRRYRQDNYIFKYGNTEDVPTGQAFTVVSGYQVKDGSSRWYAGSKIYLANYHPWGYFNAFIEYGAFLQNKHPVEGCFVSGINYFSNMMNAGNWKLRMFIKPQYTYGLNRLATDGLSINSDAGIRGFNAEGLKGTEKLLFVMQLQSYAPWNVVGFRFGPYAFGALGMLGNEKDGFRHSTVYSGFGLGLLIKNEYLVISTFQISFGFYPVIPGVGENIFKANPVKTTDFGFRDFEITHPSIVTYQ